MTLGVGVLAVLVIASILQHASGEGSECTPGTRWLESCNRCWCSRNGLKACTRLSCPPGIDDLDLETSREERSVGNRCTEDRVWKQDCNTCWCSRGGIPACTLMACVTLPGGGSRGKRSVQGQCTPGDSWRQDCNRCYCTPTGIPICTLRGCVTLPGGYRGKRSLEGQ